MKNFAKFLTIIALTTSLQIAAMNESESSESSLIQEIVRPQPKTETDTPLLQHSPGLSPSSSQETLKPTTRANPTCPLNYFKIATYVTGLCATGCALYDFYKNGFSNSNTVNFAKNLWTVQDPRKALLGIETAALVGFGWMWKRTNDLKKENCFLKHKIAEVRSENGLDFNPNDYIRKDRIDFFLGDCLKKHELRSKVEGYIREYNIYTKNKEGETQETDLFLQQEEDQELSEMGE
jgi:hypothetical protein